LKSLDTNVLVRFLIGDDEAQAQLVHRIFLNAEQQGQLLYISTVVLLETIWVLDSVYGCSRSAILEAMENLVKMPILCFERRDAVISLCQNTRDIDPADLLIGLIAKDAGCDTTLTFDRKAAKSGLFTLIE
jgi:predicted nucleic-acid-binding protein